MDCLQNESDWESSSESSGSDEQEEINLLYGNILSSLDDSIGKIDDFLCFEKGFLHGEIVCSMEDPSGQTGRVINIKMFVDLENVLGKKIKNVNSKSLSQIRSVSVGDYVVQDTWIGRVNKVIDHVSVVFDNGTKCEVVAADRDKLLPVPPNLFEDVQYPYYPGQRVKVLDSNVTKSTGWLCGTWRDMQCEGTVSAVDAGLVYVDWIASTHLGSGFKAKLPQHLQELKNLTVLSCFSHANWQLGEWCMLHFAEQGVLCENFFLNGTTCDQMKNPRKQESGFKRGKSHSVIEELFFIGKTKSTVDVLWQDGSCTVGLDSRKLIPVSSVTAHEFWPEQFVVEKEASDDSPRWGVVLGVDAKERTVRVQWRNNEGSRSGGEVIEETVSAYELVEHPDYSFCFGDVVFRVWDETSDKAYNGTILSGNDFNAQASFLVDDDAVVEKDNTSRSWLSSIGVVVGFKDGEIQVTWATGLSTKVPPYEIYRIDKYEDSTTTAAALSEENIATVNQEVIGHDKLAFITKDKDSTSLDDADENSEDNFSGPARFSLPEFAIGFFTSKVSSLVASLGLISPFGSVPSHDLFTDRKAYKHLNQTEASGAHDICAAPCTSEQQELSMDSFKQEYEESENQTIIVPRASENPGEFKQFDIVRDCSDHHFIMESKASAPQMKRSWLKKVQQEWSILENNLPETIYVRIYEDRMDILRAAIVGPTGTPYHDGLFFFDILLPPEYPNEPPLVHYNSGGLRLNPNLYESGRVCLSLLNTWTGTGTEVWTPESSTILQVLLSLQGLVLNEKPYFNEAGYDKQMGSIEGVKNSICYNESAFLLTWRSMLYVLRKPPQDFDALVQEHFTKRSPFILSACKAYMEGDPISSAADCNRSWLENAEGSSAGFKIMLAKLYPKLVEALSDKGINCAELS